MDKDFKISADLIVKLAAYLTTKPYMEVFLLIEELKSLEPVEKEKAAEQTVNINIPNAPLTTQPQVNQVPQNTISSTFNTQNIPFDKPVKKKLPN